MLKLLIGGSPCTHWSIAQTRNRETKPEGLGWELFKNYLIARDKYRPAFFLYENNKSMSPAIREQITKELNVEPILINSALVSAQNRQRLYWTNIPGVCQPEDRGILLRDILESGVCWNEKAYTLRASAGAHSGISNVLRNIETNGRWGYMGAAEPVGVGYRNRREADGRLYRRFETHCAPKSNALTTVQTDSMVAEPIRVGIVESTAQDPNAGSQQYRVYSPDGKSVALCGNGGGMGAKTGLYAVLVDAERYLFTQGERSGSNAVEFLGGFSLDGEQWLNDGKAYSRNFHQGRRLHGTNMKSVTVTAQGYGLAGHAGLYAVPANMAIRGRGDGCAYELRGDQETGAIMAAGHQNRFVIEAADGKHYPIYAVMNGLITIKGKQYPIRLADGYYIIRKLTVRECMRLQTVPDTFFFPVSDTQAYTMLGNGWTVDVIAHILSFCPGIASEPLAVLSMYDGMSCGHIALEKLGAHVAAYWATEINKYAIQTTLANFPDTVQLGDAFLVRENGWELQLIPL